jgi:hypothetical protein
MEIQRYLSLVTLVKFVDLLLLDYQMSSLTPVSYRIIRSLFNFAVSTFSLDNVWF